MAATHAKKSSRKQVEPSRTTKVAKASKKPTRVDLYQKYFQPGFVDQSQFIEQVSGFGVPVYSQVQSFAGV
jgi:hypothetical protein